MIPQAVETAVRSAVFAGVGDRVLQVEAVERACRVWAGLPVPAVAGCAGAGMSGREE